MKGSRILAYLLTTVLLSAFATAQNPTEPTSGDTSLALSDTEQVDEFGKAGDCDFSARVDNLLIRLNAQADSTAYVITYLGANSLPGEVLNNPVKTRILRYLAIQKYDSARIVFIDGGYRDILSTEFWIVPLGADPPKPSNTVLKPVLPKNKTLLWAQAYVHTEEDSMSAFLLPEVQARLDEEDRLATQENEQAATDNDVETEYTNITVEENITPESETQAEEDDEAMYAKVERLAWVNQSFGSAVAERKNSRGVIIFYADDETYDIAKLHSFINEAVDLISKTGNIELNRFQVIFGGFRENIQAEFWVVPKDSELPTPKPEERTILEPGAN